MILRNRVYRAGSMVPARSGGVLPWVPYREAHGYEEAAKELGVSEVARSARGFMRQYEASGGAREMRRRPVAGYPGQTWGQRRDAFVKRHLAQYQKRPTERRWLALMMWAYRAEPLPPDVSA